jgi:hypothetical protein
MKNLLFRGVLVLALLPARAVAQQQDDVERAKASFKAGATAYAAGEYVAAIQALGAAYAITPVPAIAFSLAQAERRQYFTAHEREHLDRAISLFRRYVDQVSSGGRRADALDALAQLEPLAAVQVPAGVTRSPGENDATRRTRLMVSTEAPSARLSLDGGSPAPSPLIREVPPGKHRVEVSAEGFYPEERELTAVLGELIPEVVTLRERPSTVVISAPSSAEIYVDGAFSTRGGDWVTLELPSGPHRLAVAEKGHRVAARLLELERGKSQTVGITLEPTRQRKAAVVLFISGAAALASTAVFGALTVRAESRAQDFLVKQTQGNVTTSDLAGYQEDVAARNRYRLATAIGLASSAGFFITGFFLYELDQPNSEQLHRASTTPEIDRSPPRDGASRRIRVTPVALPGNFGAFLEAAF